LLFFFRLASLVLYICHLSSLQLANI